MYVSPVVCVVMLSSCYNDDDLKTSISGLEDRMDKLEASVTKCTDGYFHIEDTDRCFISK